MLYNENASYNFPSMSYAGTLIINVPGLSSPIILNSITVITDTREDYSNATTIGVVAIDYSPTGVVTIDVASSYAGVISQSIDSITASGQIVVEVMNNYSGLVSQIIDSNSSSGEIAIEIV